MINLENSDNFKSWDEWERMKKAHYGTKTGFQMIGGIIDFDPDKQKDLVGGDKLTYDEYLDLQLITCESKEKARGSFALCYYYILITVFSFRFFPQTVHSSCLIPSSVAVAGLSVIQTKLCFFLFRCSEQLLSRQTFQW